jgi:hypothetical protein
LTLRAMPNAATIGRGSCLKAMARPYDRP